MLIIGIGNEFRRDDGLGPAAARQLNTLALPGVTITEQSGEGAALIQSWEGADAVILIDAVSSGSEPGTIHHFDATRQAIPTSFFSYSTHAFSVAEAVELARTLDQLPPRLLIYGVEGETFAAGLGLSPVVEKAMQTVIGRIVQDCREAAARG